MPIRLPLPPQLDRTIMGGAGRAALIVVPIAAVLTVLLIRGRLSAPEVLFWGAAAVIVGGALGTVLLPNIVHAALSLVATLLGIAGIFLLLGSELLALVQLLVYGGGVTILLLFGLMLTRADEDPIVADGAQKPFAFGIAILIGGLFATALLDAQWNAGEPAVAGVRVIGERLFRDYGVPFELASLVLLVALVGAIVVSRPEPRDEGDASQDAGSETAS